MQDYNDRRPQSCATILAAKIEGFYKGWNCSSLIRPNIFSESYSSVANKTEALFSPKNHEKIIEVQKTWQSREQCCLT